MPNRGPSRREQVHFYGPHGAEGTRRVRGFAPEATKIVLWMRSGPFDPILALRESWGWNISWWRPTDGG
ncbi:hypothetical protein LBMAG15_00610 [Actinomycetes bacterium]|nr:hypothetical protein LBMAG15_00610 [Actinomycetes bacterium]